MDKFPFQRRSSSPFEFDKPEGRRAVGFAFSRSKGRLEEKGKIAIMVNTFAHFPRFQASKTWWGSAWNRVILQIDPRIPNTPAFSNHFRQNKARNVDNRELYSAGYGCLFHLGGETHKRATHCYFRNHKINTHITFEWRALGFRRLESWLLSRICWWP